MKHPCYFMCEDKKYGFAIKSLSDMYCKTKVEYHGDICVGFIAKQNVHFVVKTYDHIINKYLLEKDQFVYCVNNTHMMPMINSHYHDLMIDIIDGSPDDILCVYALVHIKFRPKMIKFQCYIPCPTSEKSNCCILVGQGMKCFRENMDDCDKYGYVMLPASN